MSLIDDKSKREKQREILNKFIDNPVKFLIKHNVSPNILSYIGFFCSVLAAFFIAIGSIHYPIWFSWPAPFLIFWAGVFDVFDGEVARRTKGASPAGAFLDSNLDRLSDAVLIFGLIYSNLIDYLLGFLILFLVVMISYTRSRAENEGIDMKGIGLMERAERIIYIMFLISIESWVYFLTVIVYGEPFTLFFSIAVLVFVGLLILTLFQRFVFTFKTLKNKDSENI